MAEKKYRGAPFGTQTARFDVAGVHPKNKTPGTFTQVPYCRVSTSATSAMLGPGRYDVEVGGFSEKAVASKSAGPGWARAYEVARLAALPHLLHKEQWELKRMLKRKLGPGSYDIKDFLDASEEKPRSTRGIIQTKEPRFQDKFISTTPGPGTYGKGGVPHAVIEEKSKRSPGTIGILDAAASTPRNLPAVGSHLGPGTYNFDSSVEEMSKKVTSLRGPYDLFSADRNKPIKTGHYATINVGNLGPGQYEHKSFLDELGSEHKKRIGKFAKMEQHPDKPSDRIHAFTLSQNPREKFEPAPGTYDPRDVNVKPPSQSKKSPPFTSSAVRNDKMATKFFTGNFNPVGAGRYDIQKFEDAQHKNGHTSAFKSTVSKPSNARGKFLQERLRPKDVPKSERTFLVPGSLSTAVTTMNVPQRSLTVA